jgi:tetratricopeptide (TPR) repeat protein
LAITEKTVGPDHPDTAATLHALAFLYEAQGRYPEAERMLKRLLAIYEKTVGPDHPSNERVTAAWNSAASGLTSIFRASLRPTFA